MTKDKLNSFTSNDYEIVSDKIAYQGIFRLTCFNLRFRLFKGGWSKVILREVMERLPAAGILPYDPILDQIVLIEQFRVGALSNPQNPFLL